MDQVQVPIQDIIKKLSAQIGDLTYDKIAASTVAEQYQTQLGEALQKVDELERKIKRLEADDKAVTGAPGPKK